MGTQDRAGKRRGQGGTQTGGRAHLEREEEDSMLSCSYSSMLNNEPRCVANRARRHYYPATGIVPIVPYCSTETTSRSHHHRRL